MGKLCNLDDAAYNRPATNVKVTERLQQLKTPPEQERMTVNDLKLQISKLLERMAAVEAVQNGNKEVLSSVMSSAQVRQREHHQLEKRAEEEISSLKAALEASHREHQQLVRVYQEAKDYVAVLEAALKTREEELAQVKVILENRNREHNQLVQVNQEAKDYVQLLETTLATKEEELTSAKGELLTISSSRAWRLLQKLPKIYRRS